MCNLNNSYLLYFLRIIFIISLPVIANASSIGEILKKHPRANISILLEDLNSGKVIYSHNSKLLRTPASVTKSFTAYAALKHLGAEYRYKTQIYKYKNDIYIKFSGDPSFTLENLKSLISKIPKPSGRIFVDDTAFDQDYNASGSSIEDSKFCFAAPISSIIVNRNCFGGIIEPSGRVKTSKISAKIHNKLISKNDKNCSPDLRANPDASFDLTGCVNNKSKPIAMRIAYQDPRLMLGSMIKIAGFKKAPNTSILIAEHKSKNLAHLLKKMQKDSDNVYANSIAKAIGASYYKEQGTFERGNKAIMEIIGMSSMKLFDGAGISRYNLIAADHLVGLYKMAYKDKKIGAYFNDSLAVAAKDGSLEYRFKDYPELHGKIYAKTGSMKGVFTIVGYINKNQVFAIMINGFMCSINEMKKVAEEILVALINKK